MSEEVVLHTTVRETLGKRANRKLRQAGQIPAVLYGHGQENVNLAIPAGELEAMIRHGTKVVEVRGAVQDSALIKEVQWDAFGHDVLHVDLTRVSAEEAVDVTIAIELVGDAPGTHEGGILEQHLHELEIRCPVKSIPEKFEVKVNQLHVGQSLSAADVPLPPGATLVTDPDELLASCQETAPVAEEEVEEEAVAEGAEPEVIGKKEKEEAEGESSE